jgi:hypothetical protein
MRERAREREIERQRERERESPLWGSDVVRPGASALSEQWGSSEACKGAKPPSRVPLPRLVASKERVRPQAGGKRSEEGRADL